MGKVDRLGA